MSETEFRAFDALLTTQRSYIPGIHSKGVSQSSATYQKCDSGLVRMKMATSSNIPKGYTVTLSHASGGLRAFYTSSSYKDYFSFEIPGTLHGDETNASAPNSSEQVYATIINGLKYSLSGDSVLGATSNDWDRIIQFNTVKVSDIKYTNPIMEANGGEFSDGYEYTAPTIPTGGLADWTAANTPTRTGYTFKEWSTDEAGSQPLMAGTEPESGQHLYAQWEKATGKPQKVDLDCSTGGRCELTVNYDESPAKTREFQPGSGSLAWSGTAIDGVLLDASGYAADGACSDTRCWYVSLKEPPTQNSTSYQAQMPTTGATEGLTALGLAALSVCLLAAVTVKRSRG